MGHPRNNGHTSSEHDHSHPQEGQKHHEHSQNPVIGWLQNFFTPHTHGHQQAALDPGLATDRGIWALKVSFAGLMVTAVFQVVIVFISGSVALLSDTIHNFSDALTAIPLGLAFWLSRRARNRRYTYGYGRAEDIAGVIIVLMIAFSAVEAIYHSVVRFFEPQPINNLGWVVVAAVIGFLGNELVAVFRIRVGREIGSAALVADGYHARTDGFTSLAVLAGAAGVWMGYPILDPLVGLGIGIAILGIVWKTARDIWHRLMDAVDPEIYSRFKQVASGVDGVLDAHGAAIRWAGHRLWGEIHVTVKCSLTVLEGHFITEEVRHALFHEFPALVEVVVHADPCECDETIDYHPTAHHRFLTAAD